MAFDAKQPCAECGGIEWYTGAVAVQSASFNLLPGTGSIGATVEAVVCSSCGNMRHFVPEIQLARIRKSGHWKQVGGAGGSAGDH